MTTESIVKTGEIIKATDIPFAIVKEDTEKSPTDYTGCLCITYEETSNS